MGDKCIIYCQAVQLEKNGIVFKTGEHRSWTVSVCGEVLSHSVYRDTVDYLMETNDDIRYERFKVIEGTLSSIKTAYTRYLPNPDCPLYKIATEVYLEEAQYADGTEELEDMKAGAYICEVTDFTVRPATENDLILSEDDDSVDLTERYNKLLCDESEREGSNYHEFHEGDWDGKTLWHPNSLLLSDDVYFNHGLRELFSVLPDYDPYSNVRVDSDGWEAVKEKAKTMPEDIQELVADMESWVDGALGYHGVFFILGLSKDK